MSWGRLILPVIIVFVILSAFLITRSNIFTIRSVDEYLENIKCTDNEQIKNSSKILGQNFFLINSSKVENDLKKQFICIKNVTTSRQFPNRVKLSVLGREPVATLVILKNEEATQSGVIKQFSEIQATASANITESFVIDNEGVIYSSNVEQINVPRIYVGGLSFSLGQKITEDLIKNTLKILQKIKTLGLDVKEAKIYSENLLLIDAMPKIIFKIDREIDTQLASLQLILSQAKIDDSQLEFIDLRFDKPVVRLAPKK